MRRLNFLKDFSTSRNLPSLAGKTLEDQGSDRLADWKELERPTADLFQALWARCAIVRGTCLDANAVRAEISNSAQLFLRLKTGQCTIGKR